MMGKFFNNEVIVRTANGVKRPANNTCEKCRCGFIDTYGVFESDEQVANNKNRNKSSNHKNEVS